MTIETPRGNHVLPCAVEARHYGALRPGKGGKPGRLQCRGCDQFTPEDAVTSETLREAGDRTPLTSEELARITCDACREAVVEAWS